MRIHIIEGNTIINTILAQSLDEAQTAYPDCTCIDAASGGGIGDSWDGVAFVTPSKYATAEEAVAAKHVEIDALRDSKIPDGVPYNFPDNITGTIQMRRDRDIINVLGTTLAGLIYHIQGNSGAELPFKDEENEDHTLNPLEAITMGMSALSGYVSIYLAAWAHKREIKALVEGGATIAQVESYDITTGWPE